MSDERERYRDALDRIARFNEAFAAVIASRPPGKRGNLAGAALAQILANYARRTLGEFPSGERGARGKVTG